MKEGDSTAPAAPASAAPAALATGRSPAFGPLILLAAAVGLVGGLLAVGYSLALHGILDALWIDGGAGGVARPRLPLPVWALTSAGGLLVGVALRWLGQPGEISAVVDNIHMRHGRIDVSMTPSMTVASLLSIGFGGSAGPEAPLVQIVGGYASRFGDWLRLDGRFVRTLTFCGMAAALGAFFGAPLGGALFALEIPHPRGLEYYEALVPALVSAGASFVVYRAFLPGVEVLYPLTAAPPVSLETVFQGLAVGALGALVAAGFIWSFRALGRVAARLERAPVLLGGLGGLAIGLLATAFEGAPFTILFWSEYQIGDLLGALDGIVLTRGLYGAVGILLAAGLLKALSIGATLHSGFRGGFIFPLFFIGAALGAALSIGTGGIVSVPVAALCMMAAVNVGVTKTPVSTTVILTTLTGTSMLPVVGAASMAAFLLTTRVSLIRTQRSRDEGEPLLDGDRAERT